ncbi:peptidoglycan D,D-transpeptidase FtsI family protein [Granulicoccus sp. GXG6511]|uniref:peptidoglycan D,D-transpeptidase FtsI family protein n=1 Tax=Granulicoccus sp. GXG6511 TaxID=3381351 RepID=UPI003D7E3DF8
MNKPIRRVAILALIMFGLLLGNQTYTIVMRQDSLNNQPTNRRTRDEEFAQDRGPIMVGQTEIAQTVSADDQFKFQRTYPEGRLYAQITGYYSYDQGRAGLEASYNREMAGTADSQFVNRFIDSLTGQVPTGASIETTINARAQRAAFEGLGNRKGGVVAIDPRTGAILALASTPSYDPNQIANHDLTAARQTYIELNEDSDRPMANRAAREIYPPGSVFKLVTAAAALENGMTPETLVESPTQLRLPQTNTDLGNQVDCGGDRITIGQALKVSCNTAFANIALTLGDDVMRAEAEKFGFGSRPLPELNAVASRYPDNPDRPSTALTGIGQHDVATTPLQMAMVTAAIANEGQLFEPHLVARVRSANLNVLSTTRPRLQSQPMQRQNARALAQMMVGVVEDGTGTNARISGHTVGGKTGTAQSAPDRPPYAWFTSYALDKSGQPVVAVAVFVEDADVPRSEVGGNRVAAPIARAVMEAVL